jgi:fructuronate reductase
VRIVHIGVGAFHRAHQAWYTAHATDATDWGIAAFTVRSPDAADALNAQDCLYTLTTRGPVGDSVEVISSIVEAHHGGDVAALAGLVARPEVSIVTLTVTEAGYEARPGHDSVLRRLLHALEARRAAHSGPLAIVPCDNLPGNGALVRERLIELARDVQPLLVDWLETEVAFVSTSVDRITPRWDGSPIAAVTESGWVDHAPVVTEPFSDWVLAGDFPAGRPDWESAGAIFVPDVSPYEQRKLWLLNGAHTILAWTGMRRGLVTVADAVADPACMSVVHRFWEEAVRHLPDGIDHRDYREQLVERWGNTRMEHQLAQIAIESTAKLGVRVAAIATLERASGRPATACAEAIAAWIYGVGHIPPVEDSRASDVAEATRQPAPVAALVAVIDSALARDNDFVSSVRGALLES